MCPHFSTYWSLLANFISRPKKCKSNGFIADESITFYPKLIQEFGIGSSSEGQHP